MKRSSFQVQSRAKNPPSARAKSISDDGQEHMREESEDEDWDDENLVEDPEGITVSLCQLPVSGKGFTATQLSAWLAELSFSTEQRLRITKLNANENHLEIVPPVIFDFCSLRRLSLQGNKLQVLPEAISRLSNLQVLALGYNDLSTLPASIVLCASLQELYLRSNNLSHIPPGVTRLKFLRLVSLMENPLPLPLLNLLPQDEGLLTFIGDRYSYYGARSAAITFLAIRRFRLSIWNHLAKDVIVYIVAPMLYETRHEWVWRKADDIGWEMSKVVGKGI